MIAHIAIALVAFAVLLTPALINGAPIYWHDSLAHLHGGSSAITALTGLETHYTTMERAELPDPSDAIGEPVADSGTIGANPKDEAGYKITMARSPYYSVALIFFSAAGGPLAPVVMQALLVLSAGFFLLRAVFRDQLTKPALWLLAAVSVTAAGVFSAMLLPDILAPLGILSAAVLFGFYDRLSRLDKLYWFAVLIASVISHTSHLAILILLIPVGMILANWKRPGHVLAPALTCTIAVAVGILSIFVFSKTVKALYGYTPRPLPMIAASIIVDGPGMSYLRATCPESGYIYCEHLYTTATNIDQYLWFEDESIGVYISADPETREQLTNQQFSFLLDTLRFDFTGQFAASFKRFLSQLSSNSLDHLIYTDRLNSELSTDLPEPDRRRAMESAAFRDALPLAVIGQVSQIAAFGALIGLLALVSVLSRRNGYPGPDGDDAPVNALVVFTIMVIAGIVANAAITGILSNPQGRYGARVLWLLPVLLAIWVPWSIRKSSHIREQGATPALGESSYPSV